MKTKTSCLIFLTVLVLCVNIVSARDVSTLERSLIGHWYVVTEGNRTDRYYDGRWVTNVFNSKITSKDRYSIYKTQEEKGWLALEESSQFGIMSWGYIFSENRNSVQLYFFAGGKSFPGPVYTYVDDKTEP